MSRSHGRELASVTVIAVQTSFSRSSLIRMSNDDLNVFKQSEKTWQWMMIMSGVFTLRCELLLVVHNLEEVKWITAAAVFCDAELVKGAQRSRRQRQPLYCWLLEWRHLAPCPAVKLVDYATLCRTMRMYCIHQSVQVHVRTMCEPTRHRVMSVCVQFSFRIMTTAITRSFQMVTIVT